MSKFAQQFIKHLEAKNYQGALILVNSVKPIELASPVEQQNLNNAFHYACRYGDLELVEAIYAKNPDLINEVNRHKATPFHEAATNKNFNVTEFLLKIDSSLISKKNESGNTPLHFASRNGNTDAVNSLLPRMKEEDITAVTNKDELSALILAINSGVKENVKSLLGAVQGLILLEDAKGRLPVHYSITAATSGDPTGMLSILLEFETLAQINAQAHGFNNYTPVHFAADNNNVQALKVMLKICPQASKILGSNGHSPLHAAVSSMKDCTEAAKFLHAEMKEQGINPNHLDNAGKTPVILAFEKGKDELGTFLADRSGSPKSFSDLQQSQLHLSKIGFNPDEIPTSLKNFSNPLPVLNAMSTRLFNEGEEEGGWACRKAAKRMKEDEELSKSLMRSPGFSDCSGEYPPFLVKETLTQIFKNHVIEFVKLTSTENLRNRVEDLTSKVLDYDKKIILLLTNKEMTQCERALKLERKDEDECKITYINPEGILMMDDPLAKTIFKQIASNKFVGATSISDLGTCFASIEDNKGLYIIEALKRIDKLPLTSPKLIRVKSLPTKTDFDPVKAEEMMELLRDTSLNYSPLKMGKLVPLVFKGIDAQLFTPILLTKLQVTERLKEAFKSITETSKPAALIIYNGEKWSGVAFKKYADGGVILFLSDPETKLLEIVGKMMMVTCKNYTKITAPQHSDSISDSGPITLENLHKFFVTDCSLNDSKLESIFKSLPIELDLPGSLRSIRAGHIELLQKAGIQVPPLNENAFGNIHTSYIHDFVQGENIPELLLGVDNLEAVHFG